MNSHWQELDIFNITGGDPNVVQERVTTIAARFGQNSTNGGLGLHWCVGASCVAVLYPMFLLAPCCDASGREACVCCAWVLFPAGTSRISWDMSTVRPNKGACGVRELLCGSFPPPPPMWVAAPW